MYHNTLNKHHYTDIQSGRSQVDRWGCLKLMVRKSRPKIIMS